MKKIFNAIIILLLILPASHPVYSGEADFESILDKIAERVSNREYDAALELFSLFPAEEADKTETRILKANVFIAAGKPQDAIQIANVIVNADRNNTDALMVLADAAALQKKERDRRNYLERVIAVNPRHARALIDLGNLAISARNLRTAASYFDRALAAEPDNGEALVSRAAVYRYNRENRNAETLLNRAIELYPNHAYPLHERARLYKANNNLNMALRDLNKANELEPFNYWVLVDRGILLMEMNRKQDALKDFTRSIEIEPENFMAYVYSAGLKDEAGDYEGALADYTKLTKLRPEYYFAYEGIGILKMKDKKWAEARDAFLAAYRQEPKEYSYALLAAVCWMRAGRLTDPKQFLAQVIRTVPRDSIEFRLLRMYHDLNHDTDAAAAIDNERNIYKKSSMAFYLASYYDIRGNQTLANRYHLMVHELNAVASIEWRLNEWALEEKGIVPIRAGQ